MTPDFRTSPRVEHKPTTTSEDGSKPPVTLPPGGSNQRLRGRAAQVARLRGRLGPRDIAALQSLLNLRLLTTVQLQRLHLRDGTSATRRRRTQALLRKLSGYGLIDMLPRRIGGIRAGSAGQVYRLTGLGAAVLDVDGTASRHRRDWHAKPLFQDHLLAVSEFSVRLVEQCQGDAELLAFESEPGCWRRFTGGGGETVTLKPDAYAVVGVGRYERSVFVEIDQATEGLQVIERKCQLYVRYWRSGLEQQRKEVFPHVVWLVPSSRRCERIAGVIRKLPSDAQALFLVMKQSDGADWLTASSRGAAS